jgi:hypothetical protein
MAGRPALRIRAHGKISRVHLGGGLWLARCRYRDSDGVTRKVQRLGPPGIYDQYGKLAEDALIEALAERRKSSSAEAIGLETLVTALVEQHLLRLAEDGRSPVTLATYRFAVENSRNSSAEYGWAKRRQPGSMRRFAPCVRPMDRRWLARRRRSCAALSSSR